MSHHCGGSEIRRAGSAAHAAAPALVQNGRMTRPFRLPVLALLALVLGASGLLVACGGGSSLAEDPAAVLAEATLPPAGPNASTLKVEFSPGNGEPEQSEPDGSADDGFGALLGGPITIEATSEGDAAAGVTGDAKIAVGPANLSVAFRANADNTWLQVGEEWYQLGQPLGLDFAGITGAIGPLDEVVVDPKATAVEDIGGVDCDRITGRFNPAPGLTESLDGLAQALPFAIDTQGLAEGQAEISLWVSRDDGIVRRIQVQTDGAADAAGNLTIDLTVVPAEAQPVTAPEGAKPITDLLISLLGDQLGGLGGLGDLGGLLDGLGGGGLGQLGGALTGANA